VKAAETDKEKEAASNDLDAVAGNAEDDIGDRIANVREHELLYGDKSLLRVYGPLISAICATPRKYRVGVSFSSTWSILMAVTLSTTGGYTGFDETHVCLWAILRGTFVTPPQNPRN
jgi:hypothetical protein